MTTPHLLLQLGEVMLKGIGLLKYWTVLEPSTMYGFKAVHLNEPAYILGDRMRIPEAQCSGECLTH